MKDEPLHSNSVEEPVSGQFVSWIGLADRLKKPEVKMDLIPVLDLLVIALLVSLLFTRFVMLPGVRVDLPTTDLRMPHSTSAVSVLTIENQGMLFYEGSVYELSTIERALRGYVEGAGGRAVLLVKAQADMELDEFLELCRMAQEAGFSQVQIAGKKDEAPVDLIAPDLLQDGSAGNLPVL